MTASTTASVEARNPADRRRAGIRGSNRLGYNGQSRLERSGAGDKPAARPNRQETMRPLAMLIGIVMGSTLSIFVALTLTGIVLLFLPEHADRIAEERGPLLQAIGLAFVLTSLAATSFIGEIRARGWRPAAHVALAAGLVLAGWIYWPR